ncbi:alpha/beta hydrolase family protein [Streptomyces sp. 4N124]|uniref:alpha/beta hydrolase family protein n=1 Tax=Streptomyces sp. 4N124 TaxID=3457420 RepID=UPI003FD0917A
MRFVTKFLAAAVAVCLSTALSGPADADDNRGAPAGGQRTHEGIIDGAPYRIEMPKRWNGTLVLFSHGYYIKEFLPPKVALAMHDATESWLLRHGYALAASEYKDRGLGYAVEDAMTDQIALLNHFQAKMGKPRRTISYGMSQGAVIAAQLAERHPRRFAGTAGFCSEVDTPGSWNTALDIQFVVKTLLAPDADIDLVRPADPATAEAHAQALAAAVREARGSKEGRARLALAGAVANIPTWYSPFEPEPKDLVARITAQSLWVEFAYGLGLGPLGRLDLEARAGGNPSWNTGIDYRRQLAKSSQRDLVREAYAAAGLDLGADLDSLAGAERISADPAAVAYTKRHGLVDGTAPTPTLTLHTTGDGGAINDQVRWWADQVAQHGDAEFGQLYLARGGHCSYTAAEEIVSLLALHRQIETGRWGDLDPCRMDAVVGAFGPEYQNVLDFGSGQTKPVAPAFTEYTPPAFLRPTR